MWRPSSFIRTRYPSVYVKISRCNKCSRSGSRGRKAGKILLWRAGPPHRACGFSLLLGLEFPLNTWFSIPHLPWISMLMDVPKPLEPANKGLRQTDPHDTQTNSPRRTARRNASHVPRRGNAKHPAFSSTSEYRAHLGCRCSQKKERGCCMVLHACLDACVQEWLFIFIFRAHDTFVFYIAAVHTCVYVYNQMGRSRLSRFVGGRREDQMQNFTGVNTISYWELASF